MDAAFSKNNKSDSIIEMLLEKADLQGHITLEDIEEIIPRSGASAVEEMVGILNRQGVQVILPDAEDTAKDLDEKEDDEEESKVVAGVEKVSSNDTITLYLREMSKVALLKKEQEVE